MTTSIIEGAPAPDFRFDTPSERAVDFRAARAGARSVLFFLRYMGCPLCQLRIAELVRARESYEKAGARVFVALQSEPEVVAKGVGAGFPYTILCDPRQEIFKLWGIAPGRLHQYLAPSVLLKGLAASRRGFKHGAREGNERQLPAVFIVDGSGTIVFAHRGKNVADALTDDVILEKLASLPQAPVAREAAP